MRGELPPTWQVALVCVLGLGLAGVAVGAGLSRVDRTEQPGQAPLQEAHQGELSAGWPCQVLVTANVRGGPGMGHAPTMQVLEGTQLSCGASRGHWVQVQVPDQGQGWIYAPLVGRVR